MKKSKFSEAQIAFILKQAECLNAHWFLSLDDAVRKCEDCRVDYNEVRPPSAIGNKVPISLTKRFVAPGPPQLIEAG